MNSYIESISQSVWNFEFDKVDLSLDIPRIATLRGMKYLLRATVTDNPEDRVLALQELDKAMKICKYYYGKKDKIEELAEIISGLNKKLIVEKEASVNKEKRFSTNNNFGDFQDMDSRDFIESISSNDSVNSKIKDSLFNSLLYPDPEDSDGFGTGFENIDEKFKNRPTPLTDVNIIVKNLELDIDATIATINLWTAIVQFLSRNFLNGGLSMRKSWKKYSTLYKEIQRKDIKYEQDVIDSIEAGAGSFLYSVSVIPSGILKSILKVIGFREDQELGMSLVWDVLFRQGSEIPMVFLVLAANYLFLASEIDLDSSLSKFRPVIEYCLHRYNSGLTFKFVASVFVKKTGHIRSAISHLQSGIQHCEKLSSNQKDAIVPSSFYIDYGQAHMYLLDYDNAELILNKAFSAPFDFTKKGLVALHLAVCQLQLGKTDKLDYLLKEMVRLAKNHKQETYTNTKGKLFSICNTTQDRDLMLNIAAFEMMYYWREIPNMKPSLKERAIQQFIEKIGNINEIQIPDLKIAAMVIFGHFISTQQIQKATQLFNEAINMKKNIKYEKQWIAFAYFELANIEANNGNYNYSLAHLKQIFNQKSFPFDDVLQTRAKALEKQFKTKQLETGLDFRNRSKTI